MTLVHADGTIVRFANRLPVHLIVTLRRHHPINLGLRVRWVDQETRKLSKQ
jgi:hypothetical protein